MGVGLVVGVWVARYLGPDNFGLLNYAGAFAGLFAVLATLGLDRIVVRDVVRDPAGAGETLGTAFVVKLAGGVAALLLSVAVIWILRPEERLTRALVAIVSSVGLFGAFDVIDFYFQARVETKFSVWARNGAFFVGAAGKALLMWWRAPLIAFAWAQLGETVLAAAGLCFFYRRTGNAFTSWRPTLARGLSLLAQSWPQMLTSLAIFIYMKIDQIMLQGMSGEHAVGIYSAATRMSEVWYFIPMAIMASVFPSVVAVRERDRELYYARILRLFALMAGMSLTLAVPIALLSKPLVLMLYGVKYAAAGPILAVHIWASLFVFWGVAQEPWNLAEGLLQLTMYRTFAGAVINILLNLVLIPKYAGLGAAWATVIAYGVAGTLGNLLSAKTRHIFVLQMKSVVFPRYLFQR